MHQIKDIMNQYKYIKTWIVVLVVAFNINIVNVFAQAPQTFKYQSVIRDQEGRVMAGTQVGLKLNIIQGDPTGTVVYEETYTSTTNNYGLVNLDIGAQDPEYFSSIDWSDGPYFIEISIDILGGVDYKILGASELMSVPYALYALHAKTAEHSIDTLYVIDTTSPPVYSGSFIANVADDYGAIGDGVTSNTLAFSNAFAKNNDIFVPASDSTYLVSSLSIPENKRIWFERGAKLDVSGTLTGTNTEIIAGQYQIFTSNSSLAGTWNGGIAYEEWLGADNQIEGMQAMVTAEDTTRWGDHVFVSDSVYGTSWNGNMHAATKNAIYDKIETIQGGNGSGSSSFIANVVEDYGAVGDGTTDNKTAFTTALSENNDIFIPNSESNYRISKLTVPKGKRLWFEGGSVLDIEEELILKGEIVAGLQQIFSIESASKINADSANIDKAYPEWFGAENDSTGTIDAEAINQTFNTFGVVDLHPNGIYLIKNTLKLNRINGHGAKLTGTPEFYGNFLLVEEQPFNIQNLTFEPLHYSNMSGGSQSNYYYNYVIHFYFAGSSSNHEHRKNNSILNNISIRQNKIMGERNPGYWHYTYSGIKLHSREWGNSYWAKFSNISMYQSDTAIYINGYEDGEVAMVNSTQWSNTSLDHARCALYIGERSKGNVFSNLTIQPQNSNPIWEDNGEQNMIKLDGSKYNQIDGMIWDIHADSTIVITNGASHNEVGTMGRGDIRERFTKEDFISTLNNIGAHSALYQSWPSGWYGDYWLSGKSLGIIETGFNKTTDRRTTAPRSFGTLAIIGENGNPSKPELYLESQSSLPGAGNLATAYGWSSVLKLNNLFVGTYTPKQGFGNRIDFYASDTLNSTSQLLGYLGFRNNASNLASGAYGAFQIWNANNGSPQPTLTILPNKKVGLNGVIEPSYHLDLGDGTFQSDNIVDDGTKVTFGDILKVTPRSSAPSSPTLGTIYVNSSNKHIYYYNGSAWKQLD